MSTWTTSTVTTSYIKLQSGISLLVEYTDGTFRKCEFKKDEVILKTFWEMSNLKELAQSLEMLFKDLSHNQENIAGRLVVLK